MRPLPKSSLAVAAVCDRRDFEEISRSNGAHRAPLQDFAEISKLFIPPAKTTKIKK
jgi:hypothetical protein